MLVSETFLEMENAVAPLVSDYHISQPVGVGIDTQQVLEASNNHLISLASQSTSRCVDGTRWDTLDRTLDRLSQDTVILLGPYPETNCKWVGKLSRA